MAKRREVKKEEAWCVAGRVMGSGFGRPWMRERDFGERLQLRMKGVCGSRLMSSGDEEEWIDCGAIGWRIWVCVGLGGEEDREKAAGFWGELAEKGEIALGLGLFFCYPNFLF
jgi:hypothetical protein